MPTPYFVADAAQVTVLRSLASTAFGRYDLKPSNGVDVGEIYPPSAPGNEAAYVSSLDPKRRVGGMFRRFVRADVKIQAVGDKEAPASSNVEEVLDGVADRTSGDFFLESDVSRAGLGPWVPFTDFNVGDLVNVEIWGRVVQLPVVRIDPKDWSVHVGGQLLSDADARLAQNADIYNAVVSDRRDLAGLDGKIRTETKNRKDAISAEAARSNKYADEVASNLANGFEASYKRYSEKLSELGDQWRSELKDGLNAEQQARIEALRAEQVAREKAGTDLRGQLEKQIDAVSTSVSSQIADEARARQDAISDLSESFTTDLEAYNKLIDEAANSTDEATRKVVQFWSEENQNNFNKAVQLTLAAQRAYNDVNDIKWVSQDAWNEQQEIINKQNDEFRELTTKLDAQQSEQIDQLTSIQIQMAEESQGQIREVMATPGGSSDKNVKVTRNGDGSWNFIISDAVKGSMLHTKWYLGEFGENKRIRVNYEDIRVIDDSRLRFSAGADCPYVHLRWAAATKKQVSVNKTDGPWDLNRNSWTYVMSANGPSSTAHQVALKLKVTWSAATYDDTYGIRIRAGNRTLRSYTMQKLGPMSFLEDGKRWMSTMVSNATIYAGETIKVDVYSTASLSGGRRVSQIELTGTWLEEV